ncbi:MULTISPECIES: LytTR family DNA-binding domain-containing protein [unclassified Janthinobacterium]|uniref:LytR/AlgR family response regulator transcription factor n=1 Tax=unclassified Janthinobacterium TaxID=2610881 RepID=UPI00089177E1|nr:MULTISPECIES: LytTR family DNA-binding domain-containing protein [unclassified Janthinobacterium]SDA76748.1 two component transcriptional regulator, LytTR family [Janthinobacterium sp. 551a]SFB60729.1 two component transcriptional regulator, LytTR family [Janthinobacterium sp. 344]
MKILILEDEPLIAQGLEREVRAHFGAHLTALALHDTVEQALAAVRQDGCDLLLLDLHLHGADGYELLRLAGSIPFQTIIVSAHAERSITAFEFGVLDFVAKPFSRERLHKALERYVRQHTQAASLAVKKRGTLEWIAVAEIDYVQADGHYSNIVLRSGEQCFHDLAIDKLMPLLPPHFLRVHRSYIVNSLGFKRLQIAAGGKYALDTQTSTGIPVSRSSYPQLKQRLLG